MSRYRIRFILNSCLNEPFAYRFTVSSGSLSATVPARSAIAVHTGQLGTGSGSGTGSGGSTTPSGSVTVNFAETATTTFGEVRTSPHAAFSITILPDTDHRFIFAQNIFLVGSISQLGTWNTANAVSIMCIPAFRAAR